MLEAFDHPSLTSLSLGHGSDEFYTCDEFPKTTKLKNLAITPEFDEFGELAAILPKYPLLTCLILTSAYSRPSISKLIDLLPQTHLTSLYLRDCSLSSNVSSFFTNLPKCLQLTTLSVSECRNFGPGLKDKIQSFVQALLSSKLEHFAMDRVELAGKEVQSLVDELANLQRQQLLQLLSSETDPDYSNRLRVIRILEYVLRSPEGKQPGWYLGSE
jgi:hypothetical protein